MAPRSDGYPLLYHLGRALTELQREHNKAVALRSQARHLREMAQRVKPVRIVGIGQPADRRP